MSEVAEAQTTLRDQLTSAIEQHEEVQTPQVETRPRDESGKFVPKETTELKQDTPAGPTPTDNPPPVVKPRPSSWKKDYEDHWSKLDPALQDYISQREADYAKGVSTYKQNWDQAAPIYEAIQPFMPVLQQHNVDPKTWISNLGNAHQTLVMGTPEQKLHMFAKLANDYGVPLQALQGQQYDPQFSMMAQELNQLKNQWTQFKTSQEQLEEAQLTNLVVDFQSKNPLLEEIYDDVMGLLQSGIIKGATPAERLQLAYDKAIRLNDGTWQKVQEQAKQVELAKAAEAQQQKVAQAKAKAVSPRSSSPTGVMSNGNGKKGLRETLAEQLDAAMGGRV